MNALEKYQPLDMIQNIDDLARLSQSIWKSGFYKDITSAEQVGVKLLVARELGLGITAISFIYPVKGKITLGYQILIALVKRSGKYDCRFIERTETRCEVEWFEGGKSVGRSAFSMEDAKRAGLTRNDTYAKNPVEMLVARAISSGFNSYAPECAGGGLYTLGELDDIPEPVPSRRKREGQQSAPVVAEENVIDVEPVDAAPAAPTTAEPEGPIALQSEPSAGTTPIQLAKDAYAACSKAEKDAVKDACKQIGIAGTSASLVERFGDATATREGLLKALAQAVNPPERIEGEVDTTGADAFDEFLGDDTQRNIAAAEAAQDEAARRITNRDRLARAGSYGES
jgi:hypothetical protein